MTFKLEFEIGDTAGLGELEVARRLLRVADAVARRETDGEVKDFRGAIIGSWSMKP
jgi:hypothetical protein